MAANFYRSLVLDTIDHMQHLNSFCYKTHMHTIITKSLFSNVK